MTPSILNFSARAAATSNNQRMSSGESVSMDRSGFCLGHSTSCAYEMQCSGKRGVSAMVQSGYLRQRAGLDEAAAAAPRPNVRVATAASPRLVAAD